MDKLFEDYKAYYLTRSKRYANNPNLRRLAAAEKDLSDAMLSCNKLEDFKEKIGNKNELCATAIALDQAEYRMRVYTELKEIVRAKGQAEILKVCEPIENVTQLIQTSVDIMLENGKEISEDTMAVTYFKGNIFMLERIESYDQAEVPAEYQSKMKEWAEDIRKSIRDGYKSHLEETRKFHPNYTFKTELLWEYRHRRLIPLPDEILTKRINQLNNIIK
jgi:hypothetical protein